MNGTPIATGRKGPQEAVDHRHSAGRRMPIPFRAGRPRNGSHGTPAGVERGPNASETAAYEVEHRVRGEFFLHGFAAVPDNLRVKRKKIPPAVMTRDNRELNGGRLLEMPAARHGEVVHVDRPRSFVLRILAHRVQEADAAFESPLEMLSA